jgi:hypothetical protein
MTKFHVSPFVHSIKPYRKRLYTVIIAVSFRFFKRPFFPPLNYFPGRNRDLITTFASRTHSDSLKMGIRKFFPRGIKRLYREISHSHPSSTDFEKIVDVNFCFLSTRVCRSCVDKRSYFTFTAILQFKSLIRYSKTTCKAENRKTKTNFTLLSTLSNLVGSKANNLKPDVQNSPY